MTGNDREALDGHVVAGTLRWSGPLLVLATRPLAALGVSLVAVAIAANIGAEDPFVRAAPWFVVYGTLADVLCLAVIAAMARREGIGLRALFGPRASRIGRDIALGFGLSVLAIPVAFASIAATSWVLYGRIVEFPYVGGIPLFAALYAVCVWLVVALVLSAQHFAIPFVPDVEFLLWRTLQFVPLALIVGALYLWLRRITPLIVAHVLLDVSAAVSIALLPALGIA
ncbi:MAG: hypothetical protein WDZ26_06110 [Nitriliruptoraceae bacterium]